MTVDRTPWPPERDAQLTRLIEAGLSRNAIASELGVSMDSIRNRARRLGAPVPQPEGKPRAPSPEWPLERVEELKRLWSEGSSGSEVALAMGGGLTRNAVIAKVHRLGLPKRTNEAKNQNWRAATRRQVAKRKAASPRREPKPRATSPKVVVMPTPINTPETPLVCDLLALEARHCRWPIGEPQSEDFGFCGHPRDVGSYCVLHDRKAHQPGTATSPNQLARSVRRYAASGTVANEAA